MIFLSYSKKVFLLSSKMSSNQWQIVNGVKYTVDENENDIVYTYQTQQDVQKTTRDTIYFPNYIVTRGEDGKLQYKPRKMS